MCGSELHALPEGVRRVAEILEAQGHAHAPRMLNDAARTAARFKPLADALAANEQKIVAELAAVQGHAADIGGYYKADAAKVKAVMRPSKTLNDALAAAGA